MTAVLAQFDLAKPEWVAAVCGIAQALAAFATLIVVVVYTWYTRSMTQETERLRRAQTEPYILVFPRRMAVESAMIELVIANAGPGVARKIRFEQDGNLKGSLWNQAEGHVGSPTRGPIGKGIPQMAPGERVVVPWDTDRNLAEVFGEKTAIVTARYEDAVGNAFSSESEIHINSYDPITISIPTVEHSLGQIADRLQAIERRLNCGS